MSTEFRSKEDLLREYFPEKHREREIMHAAQKARAEELARREVRALSSKKSRTKTARLEKYRVAINRASREAGKGAGSVLRFCQFADRDNVPTLPEWRVRSWVEAYGKGLRSQIRGQKLRYSVPS